MSMILSKILLKLGKTLLNSLSYWEAHRMKGIKTETNGLGYVENISNQYGPKNLRCYGPVKEELRWVATYLLKMCQNRLILEIHIAICILYTLMESLGRF